VLPKGPAMGGDGSGEAGGGMMVASHSAGSANGGVDRF
jgi:hypothetical protein